MDTETKSTRWLLWLVGSMVGYFTFLAFANLWPNSIWSLLYGTLGFLYFTLLYVSGSYSLYVACRSRRNHTPFELLASLPATLLPLLVGAVGTVHGYISILFIMKYNEGGSMTALYDAHSVNLQCFLIGLGLTTVTFAILSVRLVNGSARSLAG